jgi:ribonuclease VapC
MIFVDASTLCAALLGEPEAASIAVKITSAEDPITSPIAVWETVVALVKRKGVTVEQAQRDVASYLSAGGVVTVDIGMPERDEALRAFDRFGKGRHPAALNLGDCFAYACARTNRAALLYKGDDFTRTDIEPA